MARRDLFKNSTEHAMSELDTVLRRDVESKRTVIPTVTPEEAMREKRLKEFRTNRDVTRVLFISQDTELLNPTTQTLDGYVRIAEVFDEVHILILRTGIPPLKPILRPDKRVFVYTVAAPYWWQLPIAGLDMLARELVFAEGFRPDLIVARDPYESALVTIWAGKRYSRPTQLHVLSRDFLPPRQRIFNYSHWRWFTAYFTLFRFNSIRTSTRRLANAIADQVGSKDIAPLPQLNPYEQIATQDNLINLKSQYPQYIFFMVHASDLNDPEPALVALNGAYYLLKNKRIALIILGQGTGKRDVQSRAKALGVLEQLIFVDSTKLDPVQEISYLRGAHLLLITHTNEQMQKIALKGAAAGVAMIMTRTEAREDVFVDRSSAWFVKPGDVAQITDAIHALTNDIGLRKTMAETAQTTVLQNFHQDPGEYRQQYRDSIESALFAEEYITELQERTGVE